MTFFIVSIFLYFQPQYFGVATAAVRLICILIGFAGLGLELNKISSGQGNLADDFKRGTGIFDNAGIGMAVLILWAALYYYLPFILLNLITSPLLFFGTYGTLLGIINGFFDFTLSKRDLDEQKISIQSRPEEREAMIQYNTSKYYFFMKSVITVAVGAVGFAAALLQILQILKVIP